MRLYASLFCYALHKQYGNESAGAVAREVERGEESEWAGFRTLHRLRKLVDGIYTNIDGSTLITKARCRASGGFVATDADLWVTIDDDVDAPVQTLEALIAPQQGVVAAPYWLRDGSGPALTLVDGEEAEELAPNVWAKPAVVFGHGLAAYTRDSITRMYNGFPELGFRSGNAYCVALFLEIVAKHAWVSEDVAFCWRAAMAGVPMWALCDVQCTHAGRPYTLPRAQVSETATERGQPGESPST